MLRTNLATRPFYNERAVRLGIAAGVIAVAALTAYNAAEILTLSRKNAELSSRAATAEARSRSLREQASAVRKTVDQGDIAAVQAAAREANLLIERRAFSWTDLFNRFEETLPANVRIAAVQPQIDEQGRMLVAVTVISRRVEDLDAFIEELERTRAFRSVLSRQEVTEEDGLRSVIQGYYGPESAAAPAQPASAESADAGGNKTAAPAPSSPAGAKTTPLPPTHRSPGAGR
jgi:hypothetical protein